MRESAVERKLTAAVRERGGISVKLSPVVAGLPDRLLLMPWGRSYLVELKATGGRLRPIQEVWHRRAEAIGHRVYVVSGPSGVDVFVSSILDGGFTPG